VNAPQEPIKPKIAKGTKPLSGTNERKLHIANRIFP
jgi:hypothetical protein